MVTENDIVLQMSRSSFDIHVADIIGTVVVGGTLVMVKPNGILDFPYLMHILNNKDITYIHTVPSILSALLRTSKTKAFSSSMRKVKSICSIGEYYETTMVVFLTQCLF